MKRLLLDALTGHGVPLPAVALVLVGVLVFLIARRLAHHADTIAKGTGLGGLWIGTVLLAASTSLPELFTNVNAALLDAPDIGVGDLLGAALANMLILSMLDLAYARRRILHQVAVEHALVGLLGIVLLVIAGSGIWVGGWGHAGHVGIDTMVLGGMYVGGMRLVYRTLAVAPLGKPGPEPAGGATPQVGPAAGRFVLGAVGLVAVTPLLVLSAEALAAETGTSLTFVGTLLVGVTTSLPEVAATVWAIRLGALDLAVGTVFGSVAFNMLVLLVLDVLYTGGPILAVASPQHVLTILVAVACVALSVMGILGRAQRRAGPVLVESVLVVVIYVLGVWMLYRTGSP